MTHRPFREYVEERSPTLRRLAHLLCGDWHRADDLLQGALVRLYLKWDRACKSPDLDGYARTVLVRVFLNERRSSWARRVVLVDEPPDRAASDPDTAMVLTLRSALDGLPPRQRAVIVLRFYSDLSVEQTAAALRCAPGTVKSQTSKALRRLRQDLPEPADSSPTRTR